MIEFKNVHKAFGTKKVLNGLSLKAHPGEIVFLLGCSGTGKSVALKHLVGLVHADTGQILFNGEDITRLDEQGFQRIRRKCGLVFQLPALIDSRNIFENLNMGIRDLPLKEKLDKSLIVLDQVGLQSLKEHLFDRFPPELSYGEQKRLALARTLLVDPDCLLYDEPTTGLDPNSSRLIHELIKDVSQKQQKTSIVVSHDMKNALATADRIYVLDKGVVVDHGTPHEILKSQVPLTAAFLEDLKAEAQT